ncbi:hypothetical protein [Bradyrhizobium genosp. P]|uniref:hypothetical protein n=1 Tax=Bradyrhizobium genosp. P TaxID=83641 RepID=UPI003CEF38DC
MLKRAITLVPINGPRIEPSPLTRISRAAHCNNLIGWHLVVCVGDTDRVQSRHAAIEQRSGGHEPAKHSE